MNQNSAAIPIPVPDAEMTDAAPNFRISDRRSHKRFGVKRPGKVFRRSTQQFVGAVSRDLSWGGAMLEIDCERPFSVGEVIDVALALGTGTVVSSQSLLSAIVVRSTPIAQHRHAIAVRYLTRQPAAQAA